VKVVEEDSVMDPSMLVPLAAMLQQRMRLPEPEGGVVVVGGVVVGGVVVG
jgi:hypothetical protein